MNRQRAANAIDNGHLHQNLLGEDYLESNNSLVTIANVDNLSLQEPEVSDQEPGETKHALNLCLRMIMFLFPKVEPLPWKAFFVILFLSAIPAIVYILIFTEMGFGVTTFNYLSERYGYIWKYLAAALVGLFVLLYLFDFSHWGKKSKTKKIWNYLSWGVLTCGVIVLVLVLAQDYPYGPISLFAVLIPLFLVFIHLLYKKETKVFLSWLSGPLFLISVIVGSTFIIWTLLGPENKWNTIEAIKMASKVGCKADFEKFPDCKAKDGEVCFSVVNNTINFPNESECPRECENIYESCLNPFIVWSGPMLISILYFFLSFYSTFLRPVDTSSDMLNFGKLWVFLLAVMWVSASLVAGGDDVTKALLTFTLTSFFGSFVFLGAGYDRYERRDKFEELVSQIEEKYGDYLDIVQGLFVLVCSPLVIVYVMLSFLNQLVRKAGCLCSKKIVTEEDKADWVTKRTRKQINAVKKWNHGKVIRYAIYWGLVFFSVQVLVAKFLNLILSVLIEEMKNFSIWAVTGVMVAVGVFLFLLPPIPGVPIYLAFGVVAIPAGQSVFGLVGSIGYSIAVCFVMKLFSVALQQKLIGANLKRFVSIRAIVQINSHMMRSMKLVLLDPGFSVAKVAILVGGPDWPTSVMCGIMGLELFPILLGTLPVIALVTPTVLAGSFLYMASLRDSNNDTLLYPWAGTLSTIFLGVSGLGLLGVLVSAGYFLERAAAERIDELEQIPIDEEVKKVDEKNQIKNEAYNEVTEWPSTPTWVKVTMCFSLISVTLSTYLVFFFDSQGFVNFEITDTIQGKLDGNWKNMILPLGWVAILLFTVSSVLVTVFTIWAAIATKNRVLEKQQEIIL